MLQTEPMSGGGKRHQEETRSTLEQSEQCTREMTHPAKLSDWESKNSIWRNGSVDKSMGCSS